MKTELSFSYLKDIVFETFQNAKGGERFSLLMMSIFFFSSFFTLTFCHLSNMPINYQEFLCRICPCDVFGILAILGVLANFKANNYTIPKLIWILLLFSLITFTGLFVSKNIEATLLSIGIILYCILLALSIFNLYNSERRFILLMSTILISCGVGAFIGVYDFIANYTALPNLIPPREIYKNGVLVEVVRQDIISGFRNTGQASNYFYFLIVALIPFYFQKKIKFSTPYNLMYLFTLAITSFAIVYIFKISILLSFISSIVLFTIFMNSRRIYSYFFGLLVVVFLSGVVIAKVSPELLKYGRFKYRKRILVWFTDTKPKKKSTDTFIKRNYRAAIDGFKKYPLTGVGVGSFAKYYDVNNVHSTPLTILSNTGILGTIVYVLFLCYFFKIFIDNFRERIRENVYSDLLYFMTPFIIGTCFSWAYTFHLMKREFWILLGVILITTELLQFEKRKLNRVGHD